MCRTPRVRLVAPEGCDFEARADFSSFVPFVHKKTLTLPPLFSSHEENLADNIIDLVHCICSHKGADRIHYHCGGPDTKQQESIG
jgi:hypothetical protein